MISLAFTSASAINATFATALSFTPKGFGGDELRSTTRCRVATWVVKSHPLWVVKSRVATTLLAQP